MSDKASEVFALTLDWFDRYMVSGNFMINLVDYYEKLRRVRSFAGANSYDYVMLMRRNISDG